MTIIVELLASLIAELLGLVFRLAFTVGIQAAGWLAETCAFLFACTLMGVRPAIEQRRRTWEAKHARLRDWKEMRTAGKASKS